MAVAPAAEKRIKRNKKLERFPVAIGRNRLYVADAFFVASNGLADRSPVGGRRTGCIHPADRRAVWEKSVSLAPLLNAAPAIQLHAFAAMAAFVLGVVQLAAPKGTLPHRTVGWVWVVLMVIVATTSFWIHDLRMWGPWSAIHLLSIFTLVMLPLAVLHARRHDVGNHRRSMIGIFSGALVIAGLFTFMPGRIMHAVVFGH